MVVSDQSAGAKVPSKKVTADAAVESAETARAATVSEARCMGSYSLSLSGNANAGLSGPPGLGAATVAGNQRGGRGRAGLGAAGFAAAPGAALARGDGGMAGVFVAAARLRDLGIWGGEGAVGVRRLWSVAVEVRGVGLTGRMRRLG